MPENRLLPEPLFLLEDFPSPRDFHENEGSHDSGIHDSGIPDSESSSLQHFSRFNHQFQNTPSQPANNLSKTLVNPVVFPLDPRLKEIEEPLVVKPRRRPSGALNKKRSRKSNNFEESTWGELSRFQHVEQHLLASQQRGIRQSGIRGKAIRKGQNRPQTRSDQSTSGNVTGIPMEMTSVFSV